MKIQVNTDGNIEGSDRLTEEVEAVIRDALKRFGDRITRVEAHLRDQNSSDKAGDDDMRCLLEARLAGLQPIAVTHDGATMDQAVDGAASKLKRVLSRTLERLDDRR